MCAHAMMQRSHSTRQASTRDGQRAQRAHLTPDEEARVQALARSAKAAAKAGQTKNLYGVNRRAEKKALAAAGRAAQQHAKRTACCDPYCCSYCDNYR